MELVDVHCHIEGERFEKDIEEVLDRANKAGVNFILVSGVNPQGNRKVLELKRRFPNLKASFGIYPIDALFKDFPDISDDDPRKIVPFDYKEELAWIEKNKGECLSVGEVGMDFKVIKENKQFEKLKEEQKRIFEEIILFTKKLNKPIVIHSRGAELECIELLEKQKMSQVLMHCFGGKKSLIKRVVDNGWYLSVPAVITRLEHFKTLVEMVPLDQLLTETDAPYLAPIVGERSEPRDVLITIKEIAKIKHLSEEKVAEQILTNSKKLFG